VASTLAGSGGATWADGFGVQAAFFSPAALAIDVAGAGTCQIGHDLADRVFGELLASVQRDETERRQREARR
jgi:hypothetical protein